MGQVKKSSFKDKGKTRGRFACLKQLIVIHWSKKVEVTKWGEDHGKEVKRESIM